MAKPTILIGLGTSGLRVIEEVQQFSYENTGKNKPGHVEYLYLETDENSHPEITALKNEIKRVHISLSEKEVMINSLKNDKQLDDSWFPSPESVVDSEFGAGGLPAFGRTALWGKDNFERVSAAIKLAYSRIANHAASESDDTKVGVFIAGSLTGGTATGIFIDMAYLVRSLIDQVDVFGLFLIPGKGKFSGREILYCNTYASLFSLDYCNRKDRPYKMRWPNGHRVEFIEPPYKLTQFISQDYTGPIPSISTLTGLYKMGGLFLYLNIMGLWEKRSARLIDAMSNKQIDKYGTFGLSAIQYPKAQLEEFLAIRQSIDLLDRWTDAEVYYEHGTKVLLKSAKSRIHNSVRKQFSQFLREAFDLMNTLNVMDGQALVSDLSRQARIINRKEYHAPSAEIYLFEQFGPTTAGNYYEALRNNIKTVEDTLIRQINGAISETVNQYENLHVAVVQLEAFTEAINQCIQYWKSLGVSGQPPKWEHQLRSLIRWMNRNKYGWLGESNRVLEDRMMTVLECLKMHLMANKLVDIRNNILKGEEAMTTVEDNVELPRIKRVRDTIRIIRKVTGADRPEKGETWGKSLKQRQSEIETDIRDTTIPILRVFPAGSFDEQVKRAQTQHKKSMGSSIPSRTSLIGKDNLWDYLKPSDRMKRKLYSETIGQFINELQEHGTVPDMDVSEHISRRPDEARKIAERATAPLLKINHDRQTLFSEDNAYLPKLIMASDQASASKTFETFQDMNFTKFKESEDGTFIKDELTNIMVFYTEFGAMHDRTTFAPIKHLQYIPEIHELYTEYPKYREIPDREWHTLRAPYLPFDERNSAGHQSHTANADQDQSSNTSNPTP